MNLLLENNPNSIHPHSKQWYQNPYPLYVKLRELGPIFIKNHWWISSYDDVKTILQSPHTSKKLPVTGKNIPLQNSMTFQDPPDHQRLRSVVQEFFTPKAIEKLEELITESTNELINEKKDDREMEFIKDFANRLPIKIIAQFFGIPAEKHSFLQSLTRKFIDGTNPNLLQTRRRFEQTKAINLLRLFFSTLIDEFPKCDGNSGLIPNLIMAHQEDLISKDELLEMCTVLIIGGVEATTNLLGSTILTLLQHPSQLDAIRNNPTLMKGAIEEMLRYESPLKETSFRVTTKTLRIEKIEIPQGQSVIALLSAANRDPNKFPEPDKFDIYRNPVDHFAFGTGIHSCIGAFLARLEARIALNAFISQFPTLRLENKPSWHSKLRNINPWLKSDFNESDIYVWRNHTQIRGLRYLNIGW